MEQLKRKMAIVLFFVLWLGGFADVPAGVITSVLRGGTSTNDPPVIAPNSLDEDELCYVDRTHQYKAVPTSLIGAEYVMVSNSDKTQADYSLKITLTNAAKLLLFMDNRLGHYDHPGHDPSLNPDLWAAGMEWVYDIGFMDTGQNIGIDETGDGDIDQWASVYERNGSSGAVDLFQQNDLTNPVNRNMYGVAALGRRVVESTWPPPGPKLSVLWTPDWTTPSSGYHAGWDWFNDANNWRRPFEDHPFGGPELWGFTDRMTFRYTHKRLRKIEQATFFWGGDSGQVNCMKLLAEHRGSGQQVFPLHQDFMDNFEIQSRTFSVNADKVRGQFGQLQYIKIKDLEDHGMGLGMRKADVEAFIGGEVINKLKVTDPLGQGYVGVEHAQFPMPEAPILCTAKSLEIIEGEQVSYGIRLRQEPIEPVMVDVISSAPDILEILDADPDGILQKQFDQQNWDQWQMVHLKGIVVPEPPPSKTLAIAQYLDDDPTEGSVIPVTILDKKTGGKGYLAADINLDAQVNFKDLSSVSNDWLLTTKSPTKVPFDGQFQNQDIGTTGGGAIYDDGSVWWTINGDGADIWGTSDAFHYVYRKMPEGGGEFTVTVHSLDYNHDWAKAGIMLRKTLAPDSAHTSIFVTSDRGVAFQWRENAGEESHTIHGGPAAHLKAPISLRLVYKSGIVTGYYYAGGKWIEQGNWLPNHCAFHDSYIGMAVTSHAEGMPVTATFGRDLVSLGLQPEPPD